MNRQSPARETKTLPDIVAEAFSLFARNPRQLLAMAAPGAIVVGVLTGLVSLAIGGSKLDAGARTSTGQTATIFGVLIVLVFVTYLNESLLTPLGFDLILRRKPQVRESLLLLRLNWPAVLAMAAIIAVAMVGLVMTVIGIPVAIWLYFRWGLAVQALSRNSDSGPAALRASAAAVRGRWWRAAAVQVGLLLLSLLPTFVLSPIQSSIDRPVVDGLIAAAVWLVVTPFLALGRSLLYVDLKLRQGENWQQPPMAPRFPE